MTSVLFLCARRSHPPNEAAQHPDGRRHSGNGKVAVGIRRLLLGHFRCRWCRGHHLETRPEHSTTSCDERLDARVRRQPRSDSASEVPHDKVADNHAANYADNYADNDDNTEDDDVCAEIDEVQPDVTGASRPA